jgi:beta-alanine degradation protein BauB
MRIATVLLLAVLSIVALGQDPAKVDPKHVRILFENAHMRVLEFRDRPGEKTPMHSHPAYMTYMTGPGRTKVTLPDGQTKMIESKGSDFECHPPTQHANENAGRTETQELMIEFKDAENPCSK